MKYTKSPGFNFSGSTNPAIGKKIVWRVDVLTTAQVPFRCASKSTLAPSSSGSSFGSVGNNFSNKVRKGNEKARSRLVQEICRVQLLYAKNYEMSLVIIAQDHKFHRGRLMRNEKLTREAKRTSTTLLTRYGNCLFNFTFSWFSLILAFTAACSCVIRSWSDFMIFISFSSNFVRFEISSFEAKRISGGSSLS